MASSDTTDSPLRSVHTSNLPQLFEQLRISLVVSTYQAGKVILVRKEGDALNTHFRAFSKPMGIAADHSKLTIGGTDSVWFYRNAPAVAVKLEPPGKHDACFLPRRIHVTGDIDIHEMAYDRDEVLWVVNTRFGCLCTLDAEHSFHPRWRPPFVSVYAPEDRCHLNGLALVDGRPKYVTALGETDNAGGWRANKRSGGILMDIESNGILLRGLSMPHSPRWYQGRLWLLESGQGSLAVADLERGTWKTIAQVPGFTRGLDFYGPLAFIGLSQVRESATFSGIPLVERLRERNCGVWIVHIETGQTLGFLRFESGVQEIFSVQVLPGIRFPEILEWGDERISNSYILPDDALLEVKLPGPEELAQSPAYHFQRGHVFYKEGKLQEAIAAYRQCLSLDPIFPNACYNLGISLGDAGEYEEAFACMQSAAEAEPERAEIWNSLGSLAYQLGRPKEAESYYERAVELQPDYAQAHFNLGLTLLLLGDYRRGLSEHEWRWKTDQFTPFNCPHPRWDGGEIPGKTLLIHTEQGAGDAIQFARYLPLAAERVGKLILVCRDDLMPLFSVMPGIAEIREPGQIEVAEFDTYLPLLSLPYVFGSTLETLPCRIPYFDVSILRRRKPFNLPAIPGGITVEASPSVDRRRMGEAAQLNENAVLACSDSTSTFSREKMLHQTPLKVGLVWAGSPTHKNDSNRSCPLEAFLPLLHIPGIAFYSLQKGERSQDLHQVAQGFSIYGLDPMIQDYGDTALLIDLLDLLITVDTSAAHLAGALGKPVWLLLPKVPDWRWGLDSETTPWYPSMRLFRQTKGGGWAAVMDQVVKALEEKRR